MAKRFNDNNPIGDVLKEIIRTNNLQKGMDGINVRDAWKNLMGPGISNYTGEVMLRGTVLYVQLTSAVLREELSYGREKIIRMINQEMGRDVVTDVVLR